MVSLNQVLIASNESKFYTKNYMSLCSSSICSNNERSRQQWIKK